MQAGRPSAESRARPARLAAAAVVVLAAGCGRTLETDYATVRGPSINGLAAFVQMLRDAGHAVTATSLVPSGDDDARVGTLVVFSDRFGPLPEATLDRVRGFLGRDGRRTLVLVLRDDDCAIGYWRAIAARDDLEPARRRVVEEALEQSRQELTARLADADAHGVEDLGYTLETVERPAATGPTEVTVRSAGGFADETVEARWDLHRRLGPGTGGRTLWQAGDDPLLLRQPRGDDEILVVAAATPLLNGGLVDAGNRRLAADLVARIPAGDRVHVAGSADVAGADDDEAGNEPSILRLLAVQPHPWIAAQALAALALFCWWRAPIVGRPRRESPVAAQDFGHHVAALGGLLARARGDAFAEARVEEWRRIAAPPARARSPRQDRGREPRGGRHGYG